MATRRLGTRCHPTRRPPGTRDGARRDLRDAGLDDGVSPPAAPRRRSDRFARGVLMERMGYAPGVYDLFHVGHLNILRHAANHCDTLIAGVVSDEMALLAKGRLPVVPLHERMEIVANIRCVSRVWAETVPSKLDTWHQLRFDILFKGDDWRGTAKGKKLENDFARVGVEIIYFPYTLHTSSTLLRSALELMSQPDATGS